MTSAMLDAQAGQISRETFAAMCDDPEEATELYRLYLSRLRWQEDCWGA